MIYLVMAKLPWGGDYVLGAYEDREDAEHRVQCCTVEEYDHDGMYPRPSAAEVLRIKAVYVLEVKVNKATAVKSEV